MRLDGGDRLGFASCAEETDWPVWEQTPFLLKVEAIAYVLLQKLQLRLHNETHAIAKWLLEARELGGGFRSTQVRGVAWQEGRRVESSGVVGITNGPGGCVATRVGIVCVSVDVTIGRAWLCAWTGQAYSTVLIQVVPPLCRLLW